MMDSPLSNHLMPENFRKFLLELMALHPSMEYALDPVPENTPLPISVIAKVMVLNWMTAPDKGGKGYWDGRPLSQSMEAMLSSALGGGTDEESWCYLLADNIRAISSKMNIRPMEHAKLLIPSKEDLAAQFVSVLERVVHLEKEGWKAVPMDMSAQPLDVRFCHAFMRFSKLHAPEFISIEMMDDIQHSYDADDLRRIWNSKSNIRPIFNGALIAFRDIDLETIPMVIHRYMKMFNISLPFEEALSLSPEFPHVDVLDKLLEFAFARDATSLVISPSSGAYCAYIEKFDGYASFHMGTNEEYETIRRVVKDRARMDQARFDLQTGAFRMTTPHGRYDVRASSIPLRQMKENIVLDFNPTPKSG